MAVRTGSEYLAGLKDGREVWHRGERVMDVTTEPSMSRGASTLASFFDYQHDPRYRDIVTYADSDGERYAMAYKIPASVEDIRARGRSYYQWALWSHGMFGRTPDYKNASIMSFAASSKFLGLGTKGPWGDKNGEMLSRNMVDYYDYIRKHDKVLTHTLINPTYNYELASAGKFSGDVALRVVEETDSGIVVDGARLLATLGPFADEIEVFPSTVLKADPENIPFAFAFALPISTEGLKFLCRDSYDDNKSHFDAPLSSRFEEMDSVVIFDNVRVPWERVFMYAEPELCNRAFAETNAVVHMMHQVACGKLAKAEFMVGLLCSILQASGRDKDVFSKGLVAEVMQMTETVRSLLYSAEEHAHEDEYGNFVPLRAPLDTSRNLFPRFYPRMVEILQMLGASSLVAVPSESDFSNDLQSDVEQYFQLAHLDSRSRSALFRLAHDVAISGFGSRQTLYERFFFGPPALMASAYYDLYDKDSLTSRIDDFLSSD